jgi:hypothetical protein
MRLHSLALPHHKAPRGGVVPAQGVTHKSVAAGRPLRKTSLFHPSRDTAQHRELIGASRACSGYPARALHSVILKCLAACPAKSFTVLLEALLDGVIAFRQLISAKP